MVVNKRKKNSRMQGSHTHGWGAMKKHRGSGNRGGAGMAGSGKRADSKKPSIWKNQKYFGKQGFSSKSRTPNLSTINVSQLDQKIESYVEKKLAKKEAGGYSVNLKDLGAGKLLSKGRLTKNITITCQAASAKAVESVEKAGGKVILPKKEVATDEPEGHTPKSS